MSREEAGLVARYNLQGWGKSHKKAWNHNSSSKIPKLCHNFRDRAPLSQNSAKKRKRSEEVKAKRRPRRSDCYDSRNLNSQQAWRWEKILPEVRVRRYCIGILNFWLCKTPFRNPNSFSKCTFGIAITISRYNTDLPELPGRFSPTFRSAEILNFWNRNNQTF